MKYRLGSGALVELRQYLEYLEICAKRWESPPNNSPEMAAIVRQRAKRVASESPS